MRSQEETDRICITPEGIEEFLKQMEEKGRSKGSLEGYERALRSLYDYLPEEKEIMADTGEKWKKWMLEERGFSQRTINNRISVFNSFVQYLGKRQWQVDSFLKNLESIQPELTRAEYLRLLSAAKQSDREKSYLIIKTLGGAGVRVQELPQLTVETVEQGTAALSSHNGMRQRVLRLPQVLRRELADYMNREHIQSGPIFVTEEGRPLTRTVVHHYVRIVSTDARVDPEKANPRCLWKMYCSTREGIEAGIQLLMEQTYERMLEQEQLTIGWGTA